MQAQAKKQRDSYRLLIGKWADRHHLKIKSAVRKRFDKATKSVTDVERLVPPAAQKEKGSASKSKEKETNARSTGSSSSVNETTQLIRRPKKGEEFYISLRNSSSICLFK